MKKLPLAEVQNRLKNIRRNMRAENLDGLLVTETTEVGYLCGHEHEGIQLLVTPRSQYLLTRSRGIQRAQERSVGFKIVDSQKQSDQLPALLKTRAIKMVGINTQMPHHQFLDLQKQVHPARLKPSNAVTSARAIKSPLEIKRLQKAQQIAEGIFDAFLTEIRPGVTEFHLHNRLLQLILADERVDGDKQR